MYFYTHCDIFTLFDSVSFTLQSSDQNHYNPDWNHVTHSPPWTFKCLSRRALLEEKKKTGKKKGSNILLRRPGNTLPARTTAFFSSRLRRRSHQMWALCLSATTGAFHFRISLRSAGVRQGRDTWMILFNKRELIVQKEGSVCPLIWNSIIKSSHVPSIYPVF